MRVGLLGRTLLVGGALFAALWAQAADAAEIRVYASIALRSSLAEIVPAFERASGNKVHLEITTVAALKKRIEEG